MMHYDLTSCFSQGILGSAKSGRSALVNKYIMGSYVAVEKPDGENDGVYLQ